MAQSQSLSEVAKVASFDIENPRSAGRRGDNWKPWTKKTDFQTSALKNPLLASPENAASGSRSAASRTEGSNPETIDLPDINLVYEWRDAIQKGLKPDPNPFDFPIPRDPFFHARFSPWLAWVLIWAFVGELLVNGRVYYEVTDSSADTDCRYRVNVFGYTGCVTELWLNSQVGPTTSVLERCGGSVNSRIVSKGEYWRIFTSCFLHTGLSHLFNNVVMLLWLGCELEGYHGPWRVVGLYLVAGLFSSTAATAYDGFSTVSVGASGCIFGMLGGLMSHIIINWRVVRFPLFTFVVVMVQTFTQVVYGTQPHVNNLAHIFGYISGFCSGWVFLKYLAKPRYVSELIQRAVATVITLTMVVGGHLLLYGYLGDAEKLCPQCSDLNCRSFPWGCETSPETTGECWWRCP